MRSGFSYSFHVIDFRFNWTRVLQVHISVAQ